MIQKSVFTQFVQVFQLSVALSIGLIVATNISPTQAQSDKKEKPSKPTLGILDEAAPELTVNQWQQLPKDVKEINLEDLRGKVVYVYFFQSWCPGCHSKGFPTLVEMQKQFEKDEDVVFLTIQTTFEGKSTNTPKKALATAQKFKLDIPVGHAEADRGSPQIMQDYRSGGTPWTIVIDKNGVVRYNDFHIKTDDATKLIKELKKK